MPYTTTYVDDGKGAHKIGLGVVTGLDIYTSAWLESQNEARAKKLRYLLVDFSGSTDFRVTTDDIRRIVEVNRKLAALTPQVLIAIIARTPLPYAMARLWHTLSDDLPWKSCVFHTREDAIFWLQKELVAREGTSAMDELPSLRVSS